MYFNSLAVGSRRAILSSLNAIAELLYKGEDVLTARDLAGHSSADTTAIYDKRGEARKRQASSKLGLS